LWLRFKVERFKVERFRVQRFRGSKVQRLEVNPEPRAQNLELRI